MKESTMPSGLEGEEKKIVKVTYRLRKSEYDNIKMMAKYLYEEKALSRATVGSFSWAAVRKVYEDINSRREQDKKITSTPT